MMRTSIFKLAMSLSIISSILLYSKIANAIKIVRPGYEVKVISTGSFPLVQSKGLAIDTSNNIYIGNNLFDGTSQLLKITPSGSVSSVATFSTFIGGLTIDNGDVIFGSLSDQGIFKVERDKVSSFATGLPSSVAQQIEIDNNGNLFVAYFNEKTIAKVSPQGQVTTFVSSNLEGPFGVAFRYVLLPRFIVKYGSLFIGDNANDGNGPGVIKRTTPQGSVNDFFRAIPGRLIDLEYNPISHSFLVANQGNFFDSGGSPAINEITNGRLRTFAEGFDEFPREIEFDRNGTLYVVDSSQLYKISLVSSHN